MYDVPVISVDGLDIHSVYQAAVMAIEWRTRYQEDIIIGTLLLASLDLSVWVPFGIVLILNIKSLSTEN